MEPPKTEITIRYEGNKYVAFSPEYQGCHGAGWSYAAALADIEQALFTLLEKRRQKELLARFSEMEKQKHKDAAALLKNSSADEVTATAILRKKFGKVFAKEYIKLIGLECDAQTFSCALQGFGRRDIRVQIALAIDVLPSVLWKGRSFKIKKLDDDEYFKLQKGK